MIEAFLAEAAGTLVGALLDPIIWVLAFGASPPRWRFQPWLGIVLAGSAGALLYFVYYPPLDLGHLPQFTGKVLSGVIPVLIFQTFHRVRGKAKSAG